MNQEKDEMGVSKEKRSITTYSYEEVVDLAEFLGKSLINRNLYCIESEKNMKLIGIYSKNRF